VTGHRDVRDFVETRHPVERRVGLDEPAVRLPLEEPEHLVVGADQHVEPGRQRADRRAESTRSRSNIPTIVCIQVVPHVDGVEITTSPGRNVNRSHRALSTMTPRYRRTGAR